MFEQVCNVQLQKMMLKGQNIPIDANKRLSMLSKSWKIRPISYKQFSNLVTGKNEFYKKLVEINGATDPLRKTLIIIDEAHKLYGGADLSSTERPDMNKLSIAIQNSYKVSGESSVKLLLMTGTPITNDPMELIKLLNLIREDPLPSEYKDFSAEFLDVSGKFTKKGMRNYLDKIAGSISYLSRERDARQFSQPIIVPITVPIGKGNINHENINELEDRKIILNDTISSRITEFKESKAIEKREIADTKKKLLNNCKQFSSNERKDCITRAINTIDEQKKDFDIKYETLDKELIKDKAELSDLNNKYKDMKRLIKEDTSQENAIENKCKRKSISKPLKKKTSKQVY